MMVNHGFLHNASRRLSKSLVCVKNSDQHLKKTVSILLFSALFITASPSGFANQEEQESNKIPIYGPIKAGQTLWNIAEETRVNKDVSIEQQVYALYKANPDAFQSGNMNVLRIGIQLQIPDSELVFKTSNKEAKKQLSKHVHAIEVLRVDAKHLRTAKANTKQYKKSIKKIQKELGKYRYESRDWNRTYLELVKAKRNYKKSKSNVAKLHRLLLEKATLKYSKPTIKNKTKSIVVSSNNETTERLTQIQSSLSDLNQSNATLTEKVNNLATLNERVIVLEEELGKNDEVVIQLKNTLEALQNTILKTTEKQIRQNENHQQEIENLSELKNKTMRKAAGSDSSSDVEVTKAQSIAIPQTETKTEVETINDENSAVKKPPEESIPADQTTTIENKLATSTPTVTKENKTLTEKTLEEVKEDASGLGFTPTEYIKMQALKAGFSPAEIEALSEEKTKEATETLSTAKHLNEVIPKLKETNKKLTKFQSGQQGSTSTNFGVANLLGFLKEHIILIGGLLNGLILIFVVLRIRANKQSPLTVDDFKPEKE